jgi:peptidoglycan-N-acetylglucosamine deacetylase
VRIGVAAAAVAIAAGGAWVTPAAGVHAGRVVALPKAERLVRTVTPASLRHAANPQFAVELVPGRSVEVRGAVSHRLVSSRFVPNGPAAADNAVALTFDDGPSEYTARFVAELERLRVPATFFVIGSQAAEHPELVRLEAASGMAVGDHSWSHPLPFASLPGRAIRSQIDECLAVLRRIGVPTRLFRPPGGEDSRYVIRAARRSGLRVVLWSVDARDWVAGSTAAEIEQRVLSAVRPGSIVVMHDGGGNREATLAALPEIVAGIRARGLGLVALGPVG